MAHGITDFSLITVAIDFAQYFENKKADNLYKKIKSYPLDAEIINLLTALKPSTDEDSIDYSKADELDHLWKLAITKSIECLRYFDTREPFNTEDRQAVAYGIEALQEYHQRYTDFESMLYGSSAFYRDHVFHVVRTWLLGIFCLLSDFKEKQDTTDLFIDKIIIDGELDSPFSSQINNFEKISMWSIIALTHDLGYPLEKAELILDKTRKMMKDFIPRPNIWNNFGFNGTQDSINEYIIKFISTKMKVIPQAEPDKKEYLGRIQPKYYLKLAKSLEGFKHGIISAVIIYKMLLYFLESDFNLNDDHHYEQEDARQFYIRREILRSISAHTCPEIYNIHTTTFSSLLFLCDELQEWGRKSWNDMYAGLSNNSIQLKINTFSKDKIDIIEEINMKDIDNSDIIANNILRIFDRQYSLYKTTFRDGQYTNKHNFCIAKEMKITLKKNGTKENTLKINYTLSRSESDFNIDLKEVSAKTKEDITKIINKNKEKYLYNNDIKIA